MKDKSLSTYAHNVKIVTQGGQVTLKGPVRSEHEKKAIEAKAAEVAGDGKVTSELNIKPQQQTWKTKGESKYRPPSSFLGFGWVQLPIGYVMSAGPESVHF